MRSCVSGRSWCSSISLIPIAFHGAAIAELDAETLAIEKLNEMRNLRVERFTGRTAMVIDGGHRTSTEKERAMGRRGIVARSTRARRPNSFEMSRTGMLEGKSG